MVVVVWQGRRGEEQEREDRQHAIRFFPNRPVYFDKVNRDRSSALEVLFPVLDAERSVFTPVSIAFTPLVN